MLTYDSLVAGLISAWTSAGFHEHELIETIQPETQDRQYKADLFPDHADPLEEDEIPPWVEVSFNWSSIHQLRSEGHNIDTSKEPLNLTWLYNVIAHQSMHDRNDQELVRMFQRAVHIALRRFFPEEDTTVAPVAVEVRRIYHTDGRTMGMEYVQLVSPNITDLTYEWEHQDMRNMRVLIQSEFDLANAVVDALSSIFNPPTGKHGMYQSVDTA